MAKSVTETEQTDQQVEQQDSVQENADVRTEAPVGATAAKKKKKKKKKKCTTGAASASQCASDVNTRCNTKFPADVTNCVASYAGCCDIAISCDFAGAQACLDRSPYQKDPVV